MPRSFSILLAEPSPILREKIAGVLARDDCVWCVLQVSQRSGLACGAADLRPDLILADLSFLRDPETVALLRRSSPGSLILALTDQDSEPYARAVERLGLDGFIEKNKVSERLANALHLIMEKERVSGEARS